MCWIPTILKPAKDGRSLSSSKSNPHTSLTPALLRFALPRSRRISFTGRSRERNFSLPPPPSGIVAAASGRSAPGLPRTRRSKLFLFPTTVSRHLASRADVGILSLPPAP